MERAGDSDYQLPKELDKFRQSVLLEKTKKGEPPRHALFTAIDELFDEPLTLRDLIMARALSEIRTSIQQESASAPSWGLTTCSAGWTAPCKAAAANSWRRRSVSATRWR